MFQDIRIGFTEVPSPWTSCECSGCGYTASNCFIELPVTGKCSNCD